jgi:uncharacterized protein (DUF1800 family)
MGRSLAFAAVCLAACASAPQSPSRATLDPIVWPDDSPATELAVLNRVSWGANRASQADIVRLGTGRWLDAQLRPAAASLPPHAQATIDQMTISQRPIGDVMAEIDQQRRAFQNAAADDRKAERQAYQQELTRLAREAQTRMLLRALYSPNQLEEEMTWFWMNHFSVFQQKGPIRALVGDYEERAIRPYALGRFRDLLGASARHPAMLVFLDNARNSAGRLNENYARELMELHTLGVDGGYTQRDVEALARILTGWSLDFAGGEPSRFYPRRHVAGDKQLLGTTIRGTGAAELDQALDLLARHPSTARFVSRKLATFFVSDEPPADLVARMSQTFSATDGDIAQVLRTMFASPEFRASLGTKFKDPLHYTLSALRLALDDRPLPDPLPIIGALARMGEPLYARATPDGYPLTRTDWASPGQLATRFEIARGIAYRVPTRLPAELAPPLGDATRDTLAKASSAQEWNLLLLSSPEFMHR